MIDREAEILISDTRADPAAILEPEAGLILLVYAPNSEGEQIKAEAKIISDHRPIIDVDDSAGLYFSQFS